MGQTAGNERMNNKGCVHIYYGDGKGKTTAAVGLGVRAAGAGLKVLIYQFLKDNSSSECSILKNIPGITLIDSKIQTKFTFNMTPEEKEETGRFYQAAFKAVAEMAVKENYDVLLLDEILHVINNKMLPEEDVLHFLEQRPGGMEVVMTGYNPSKELIEHADYVSHIIKEKHPFDQNLKARMGIER